MDEKKQVITRRDFIKGAAYGTLAIAMGLKISGNTAHANETPFDAHNPVSKVVLVRNQWAVDNENNINNKVVDEMLSTGIKALCNENDVAKAWAVYFRSSDTVGIKYSRCGWMRIPTEQAVIDAIANGLSSIGIPQNRILSNDYGMPLDQCTALVNVTSVKVHSLTGIAASIKNYINFTGNESSYHADGSVKLGEAWLLPNVKGKTKLIIIDALRPYFGPGPQVNPLHRWNYKGIIIGTDPVALDTVCLKICQEKRNLFKGEEWLINPPPKSIAAADKDFKLGTSDPLKIKVVKLGWKEEILI